MSESNVKFSDSEAIDFHARGRPGKIEIVASKPMATQRDLSLAYQQEHRWTDLDAATVQRYVDVEVALARVQAALGIIPEAAAQAIATCGWGQ